MNQRQASGFSLRTVLLAVIASFAAFIAMLYFIGVGDTGGEDNDGRAHAASKGLNGYAGLAKLLELEGYNVTLSRSRGSFEAYGLLVLTPPMQTNPQDFAQILQDRFHYGPTLVIMPKWWVNDFSDVLAPEIREQVKDGWVRLAFAGESAWAAELPELYAFKHEVDDERESAASWSGFGLSGELPDDAISFSAPKPIHDVLVEGPDGNALAFELFGEEDSEFYNEAQRIIFVTEPDLVNNYGLADETRAALALQLVQELSYDDEKIDVTFDLTLNGLGGAKNLLTLVFTPPFLAATLCLIAAIIIIGWRAFRRFGPPRLEVPAHAFGKTALISNSAGMIIRARRLTLLTAPYAELMKRRIAKRLGLQRFDNQELEAAFERALPDEQSIILHSNNLREAQGPKEILDAARKLHELERKLIR